MRPEGENTRRHLFLAYRCWHRSHRWGLPCYRRQRGGPICRKHLSKCWDS